MKQTYDFTVSTTLTVYADIAVVADSREEAEKVVREQLNSRVSTLTDDLSGQASERIEKYMGDSEFGLELIGTREPEDGDLGYEEEA